MSLPLATDFVVCWSAAFWLRYSWLDASQQPDFRHSWFFVSLVCQGSQWAIRSIINCLLPFPSRTSVLFAYLKVSWKQNNFKLTDIKQIGVQLPEGLVILLSVVVIMLSVCGGALQETDLVMQLWNIDVMTAWASSMLSSLHGGIITEHSTKLCHLEGSLLLCPLKRAVFFIWNAFPPS